MIQVGDLLCDVALAFEDPQACRQLGAEEAYRLGVGYNFLMDQEKPWAQWAVMSITYAGSGIALMPYIATDEERLFAQENNLSIREIPNNPVIVVDRVIVRLKYDIVLSSKIGSIPQEIAKAIYKNYWKPVLRNT